MLDVSESQKCEKLEANIVKENINNEWSMIQYFSKEWNYDKVDADIVADLFMSTVVNVQAQWKSWTQKLIFKAHKICLLGVIQYSLN